MFYLSLYASVKKRIGIYLFFFFFALRPKGRRTFTKDLARNAVFSVGMILDDTPSQV